MRELFKKKQTKITMVVAAVWVGVVLVYMLYALLLRDYTKDLTDFNDVAVGDRDTYITDNTDRGGIIYEISDKGKVRGMFETRAHSMFSGWDVAQVYAYERMVYAVLTRTRIENKQEVREYEIVAFDEELGPAFRTPPFKLLNTLKLSGFSMGGEGAYLTYLTSNGQMAYVYLVPASQLAEITTMHPSYKDEQEFQKQEVEIAEYQSESSVAGRFFAQAEYDDGILLRRMDNEAPTGPFAINPDAKKLFENRKMSLFQRIAATGISFVFFILIMVAGVAVIILVSWLLRLRRRVAYAIFTYEVVLAVLIGFVFFFMMQKTRSIETENYERFERYFMGTLFENLPSDADLNFNDDLFYDTDTYVTLQNRIASQIAASEGAIALDDICIVDRETGLIALSGSGRNKQYIGDLYGEQAAKILSDVSEQKRTATRRTMIQGAEVSLVAKTLDDQEVYDYAAVGISEYGDIMNGFFSNYGNIFRFSLILFAAASGAGLIFFFLQAQDLRHLAAALKKVANGQETVDKPIVVGTDMNYMWNSVFEIQKKIRNTNRIKYLTYEAYYRFAPKNIERILKKDSITEVVSGNAIQLSGTMAFLSAPGQRTNNPMDLDRMNHFMEIIEHYQKQQDGIFISSSSDLSFIKLLFLEESKEAAHFGINFMEALREWQKQEYPSACILMHYAPFVYGIAGTNDQASAFLSSPETEDLEDYMDWFRRMRLGVLITSAVRDHEDSQYDLRYIGFVTPDAEHPEHHVELYEVLDACSTRVRQIRLQMQKKFAEALDLFYKQDFYFARNSFTEILREMPEDEITKWYLFECERYLNEADGSNFVGALHME